MVDTVKQSDIVLEGSLFLVLELLELKAPIWSLRDDIFSIEFDLLDGEIDLDIDFAIRDLIETCPVWKWHTQGVDYEDKRRNISFINIS